MARQRHTVEHTDELLVAADYKPLTQRTLCTRLAAARGRKLRLLSIIGDYTREAAGRKAVIWETSVEGERNA